MTLHELPSQLRSGARTSCVWMFSTLLLVAVLGATSSAQTINRVGTTAAPFLKIGVGARAEGMGEASTTTATDASALYWNPAGTAGLQQLQAIFSYDDYIADVRYSYGALVIPVTDVGTFGAFFGALGMDDIERTTVQYPNGTGERVSASSYQVGISYARALTDRFFIGFNGKYIRESIWHSAADGFAADIGVVYTTLFKNLKIGMSISNFGTSMQMSGRDMLVQHDIAENVAGNNRNINADLETDQFPLPVTFRFGLSANVLKDFLGSEEHDWIVAVDAIHPNDNSEYVNLGTELALYRRMISVRAGYRQLFMEDREGGLTLGVGAGVDVVGGRIEFDYAYVDLGRLENTNKFTLLLTF